MPSPVVTILNGNREHNKTLLIAIETAPYHFDERAAIRDTWMKYLTGSVPMLAEKRKQETDIIFFIGLLNPIPKPNSTLEEQPAMIERHISEEMRFGDIVRLTDFYEDYSNLTRKTLSVMEWATKQGYQSMFKTDDDSFLRVDQLWDQMDAQHDLSTTYLAHCSFDFPVNQDPDSKNYMFDTFPFETIPILCHGGGYLVGHRLLNYIVNSRSSLTMHRNEDVAISLWLTGQDSHAPKLFLDTNLPVTFFWEECNPTSVYLNPMRIDDMRTAWSNVVQPPGDVCANGFQLREFLDLLDELQREEEEQSHPK